MAGADVVIIHDPGELVDGTPELREVLRQKGPIQYLICV
jgi:hypothetical protein